MSRVVVVANHVAPQRWRNGGGLTRELLAWPDAGSWCVRISVAEIAEDGPFSPYPGVERWFCVLKGVGVRLDIDGAPRTVRRIDAPVRFSGDSIVSCRLIDGPTSDLNLMTQGSRGEMTTVGDGQAWTPGDGPVGLFTAVAGVCSIDGDVAALPPYALLWLEAGATRLTFTAEQRPAGAVGWWLRAGDGVGPQQPVKGQSA